MDALIRCHVTPGMFTGEVAVRGMSADGTEFSLFVSDEFVDCELPLIGSGAVNGWLRVEVLAREGALALIRLPSQSFENGQTVTVRDSDVELRTHREAV